MGHKSQVWKIHKWLYFNFYFYRLKYVLEKSILSTRFVSNLKLGFIENSFTFVVPAFHEFCS